MDEPGAPELPWWTVDPRTIFELDETTLAEARRKVRRSLRGAGDWELAVVGAFELVVDRCARREEGEEVWLTRRMGDLYRALHAAGVAHTFELRIHRLPP
jgi:leucyl/phenylalanyl-tRNA--protein transferase